MGKLDEHRETVEQAVKASLLGSAGKIPLHGAKKKGYEGKVFIPL